MVRPQASNAGGVLEGLLSRLPRSDDGLHLGHGNEPHNTERENGGEGLGLLELVDGRASDLSIEKESSGLANEDAKEGNHGNTAVLALGLGEGSEDLNIKIISVGTGKIKRIKEAQRTSDT